MGCQDRASFLMFSTFPSLPADLHRPAPFRALDGYCFFFPFFTDLVLRLLPRIFSPLVHFACLFPLGSAAFFLVPQTSARPLLLLPFFGPLPPFEVVF